MHARGSIKRLQYWRFVDSTKFSSTVFLIRTCDQTGRLSHYRFADVHNLTSSPEDDRLSKIACIAYAKIDLSDPADYELIEL